MVLEVEKAIKNYLLDKGISQAHVSRESKINPVKLNLALNGNRRLTFYEYAVICAVLGVNTDFFLKPRLPDETK